ncbi:hypothetical protein [Clostridium perfringens]|uniref:hypothetical protein n=2 Tax=Clostridium perfringens TaxID=1502 RepID=UPI0024BC5A7C|nr:hypothetical protein [Clostridium perfringens]
MENYFNFIISNKEIFLTLVPVLTFLFSIFTFFKNNQEKVNEKKISNILLILENFYSPIITNKEKKVLFDEDIIQFYHKKSFLLTYELRLLCQELINLEKNIDETLSNKKSKDKYLKSREFFLKTSEYLYTDFSNLYISKTFFINSKYFLNNSLLRFLTIFLDYFCWIQLVTIIITIFINLSIDNIIYTFAIIDGFWLAIRYSIVSSARKYIHSPKNYNILNSFNLYLANQISPDDANYKKIFSTKKVYIYKGLPIIFNPNSFLDLFSLYRVVK